MNIPELNIVNGNTSSKLIEQLESAGIRYSDEASFVGTDSNDKLFGGDSANTITSGQGDDVINAGKGNDTLVFAKGDGKDTIINGTEANEVDTIKFTGVTIDELTYKKDGDNLVIGYIDNDTDSITVKDYYKSSNTVKKFIVKDENEVSGVKEYDIEKDLKNNIKGATTEISGTQYNDRIWGTDGDDTITDTQGSNEFIGGKGADTYNFTSYGNGFADRRHDTIIMGTDSVQDTIVFKDDYDINSGYFNFLREGNNLRIWYNLDSSLSDNENLANHEVTNYNGSEVYKDWSSVYCSSLTIKDYFLSTNENCTIDKLVINDEEYSIFDIVRNSIDLDSLVDAGELEDGGTYHATRFNDYITTRRGLSDEGEKVYGGDGDDFIGTWGRRDSYYGEQGNDTIYINENGVLADGGVGDDEITITDTTWHTQNPDGVRVIGGKGNDILTDYANAKVIYEFATGDGTDIINYKGGNDVIKFTDINITDITFGHYDLVNKTLTLNYGTSDSLTINGLSTDRNTVKIEDSTGTQYTVIIGDGDNNNFTVQKPNAGENAVFISTTGRDSFDGNTGINVFTNCNNLDGAIGSNTTNFFIINSETNVSIYAHSDNDKIILKNLELSELNYEFGIDGDGTVKITNTLNSQEITLFNFASYKVNPTIVDKNGHTTTIFDELSMIFPTGDTLVGTEGTDGNDILIGSGATSDIDTIVGGKGNDTLFGRDGADIYEFNKGDGNDVLGRYCGDEATLRFNDSTYEELNFTQLSGNKYQVTYNDGADSVIFYNDQVTKFIVKDTSEASGYKEYSMATDMAHKVTGDGVETNLVGSDINDVFTGTSINETMTGGEGSNIYNFTTGGGTDTVVITSNTDTINFTDVKTDDLTFSLNGSDLEIAYGTGSDKVIVKDYAKTLPEVAITGADSTSTTAMEGFGDATGATIVNGVGTGTDNADILIAGATDDTITGGKGDDTISGGTGNNTYIFNKGDGNDTINYATGTDVIKFNDVEITDINFGHYDLVNKTLTLNYGTSDSLTINGLTTDRNTVKIEDSTETQYTVIIGDGDNNVYTRQKPNAGENAVLISSTGSDSFEGNTGINVFTNCNNLDGASGSNTTNWFIINSETNASIYAKSDNDKIILKNLELSQLNYELITNTGRVKITNTVNSREVNLFNFTSYRANPTIVDKNGNEVKVLEKVGVIFGDVGTSGNDTICSDTNNGVISGNGGSDLIIANCRNATIYSNKEGVKDTTVGTVVTINTGNNSAYNIYAQSETNIINHQASQGDDGTNYYVYSDQKTTITETAKQPYSTLHFLNTDDVNDIDGAHTNLNIVFNVSKDYKTVQGATAIGDVRILDDNNFANWKNGASYKDITLKGNCVETINSSDGYSITSTQIAQLAENVASWLAATNKFANVNEAMSGGTTEQIAELTAYFTNASNWTATV
ncbi:MAG: hypothetical protein IKA31_00285 [Clostridia bacterium]|nr:hypothetical protein [Clostridia bacterium]